MLDYASLVAGLGCGVVLGWLLRRYGARDGGAALNAARKLSQAIAISEGGDYKLILVVRNDLKMGKGKIAAQCSHAALAAYKRSARTETSQRALKRWEREGQAKVVVKIEDGQLLSELERRAREAGLLTSVIQDAGRTQIAPGSVTVMGVGPAPASELDPVTGHLKLL